MKRTFVTLRYFETYYFANVISNVLEAPATYLRNLHDWHENSRDSLFFTAFSKRSVLHSFSEFIIESLADEGISDVVADAVVHDEAKLWVDNALAYHGIPCTGFRAWLREQGVSLNDLSEDHIAEYHRELYDIGTLEALIEQMAAEVFHVLFGNRALLQNLHLYIASIVRITDVESVDARHRAQLTAKGRVRRVAIPQWARRAVFYRDRGLCTRCHGDLSGLVSTQPENNFDHIVPLAEGGINDVTNLQLLCGTCNRGKSQRVLPPSTHYEAWF